MIRTTAAAPGTLAWIDLHSTDAAKARAFYGPLLGWTFVRGDDPATAFYGMALREGLEVAGLGRHGPHTPFPPQWNVFFSSADLEATVAKVQAHGGTTLFGPVGAMEAGRLAYFRDPTGAVFCAWQAGTQIGMRRHGEMGALCWAETYSRDAAVARDFYAKVFSLEIHPVPGIDYATLQRDGQIVCGVMQMPTHYPKDTPSHWTVYFAVEDVDAALEKVVSLGGTVVSPAFDTPFGRLAFVRDSEGIPFNLMRPSSLG